MTIPLRFRRVKVRVRRSGLLYIALTLMIGVAAVNTLNNLLYLITAGLLALMAVSGMMAYLALRGLELDLELPEEWYAAHPAPVRAVVRNRKRGLSTFLITFQHDEGESLIVEIPPGSEAATQLIFRPPARGYFDLGELAVSSEFPFGLFRRGGSVPLRIKQLAYPAPREMGEPAAGGPLGAPAGPSGHSTHPGYGGDYRGSRMYVPGDPLSRVDWRVFGRLGYLHVKEFDEESNPPLLLTLDSVPGPDLETRLGQLTTLVLRMCAASRPVGLMLGSEMVEPGIGDTHRERLLRMLALYPA